ncbi:NADPH oxidase 5-like [Amphiura filiformis]|uniref:NADPH oxidase 5-like n=1 Tax=Amphiura filiformis TaxID=82378 RepID=UPI003B20EE94
MDEDGASRSGSGSSAEKNPWDTTSEVIMDKDLQWLKWAEHRFQEIAGGKDSEVDLQKFRKGLQLKNAFFCTRFFNLFDKDNSGSLTLDELMKALFLLTKGSIDEKLRFIFNVYDVDGSGEIDQDELKTIVRQGMEESSIHLSEDKLDHLTTILFESADTNGDGDISFDEFKAALEGYPDVMKNLTISAVAWLKTPSSKTKPMTPEEIWKARCNAAYLYALNNPKWIFFMASYIILNLYLFIGAGYKYYAMGANIFVIIARGCGMCLNFNSAFVVALMLRKTLSILRNTKADYVIPFDKSVDVHKLAGYCIVVYSLVHSIAHCCNGMNAPDVVDETTSYKAWQLRMPGIATITGFVLDLYLAVLFLGSLEWVRRSGHFQIFYMSHLVCYMWYLFLLLIHGPRFWKFFLVPGGLYLFEKISDSEWVMSKRFGDMLVKRVVLLPSKVTHLVINRPLKFDIQAGDYVFLNIPKIAPYEWHPFTISSPPENTDDFSIHVRTVGNWTGRLYEYFDQLLEERKKLALTDSSTDGAVSKVTNGEIGKREPGRVLLFDLDSKDPIQVKVQGPYGTPSTSIFQAQHAVLIGAGIGVTPFASIVQSIVARYKSCQHTCPKCEYNWSGDIPETVMSVRKVDFVWINRSPNAFEWFVTMLSNLEDDQDDNAERFLDIHLYMTAMSATGDVKSFGLQMALDAVHEREQRDALTGLKTKLKPGKPDWSKLFTKIKGEKKGRVDVFFCGPPVLGRIVRGHCDRFQFGFHSEVF